MYKNSQGLTAKASEDTLSSADSWVLVVFHPSQELESPLLMVHWEKKSIRFLIRHIPHMYNMNTDHTQSMCHLLLQELLNGKLFRVCR